MIVPVFKIKATGSTALLRSIVRVRRRIENGRDYLETWFAEGHPGRIQTQWFQDAGPDAKQAPRKLRRPWLFKTNRRLSNFYAQVQASHSLKPNLSIRDRAPRWVWTKNTLRSTYEPVTFSGATATIDSTRLTRLHDAAYYSRHKGPFVDAMIERGAEPWDTVNLEKSATDEVTRMIADDFRDRFVPRRILR